MRNKNKNILNAIVKTVSIKMQEATQTRTTSNKFVVNLWLRKWWMWTHIRVWSAIHRSTNSKRRNVACMAPVIWWLNLVSTVKLVVITHPYALRIEGQLWEPRLHIILQEGLINFHDGQCRKTHLKYCLSQKTGNFLHCFHSEGEQ